MSVKNSILNCKAEFLKELAALESKLNVYIKAFPKDVRTGLPCFDVCSRECKMAFLDLSAEITSSLEVTDKLAATVSSLLLIADSNCNDEHIATCSDLLNAYENYKASVCGFLDEGYKILNQKNEITAMMLFRLNRILSDAMTTFKANL